jgi:tetratricopeptide (TPR) repeat protein
MFDAHSATLEDAQARAQGAPHDADAHVAYAVALLRSHKGDEASREIEAALQIDSRNEDAHFVAFKIALEGRNLPAAEEQLHDIEKAGGAGYTVSLALAEVARGRRDKAGERAALEQARRFDTTQADPLRALYELADDEGRDADALDLLRDLTKLDQHDRRSWGLLLEKLASARLWDEAKRVGEAALYVDVESAANHVAYARALAATGDHAKAVFELESALLCDSKPEEKAAAQTLLAAEKVALTKASQAKAK